MKFKYMLLENLHWSVDLPYLITTINFLNLVTNSLQQLTAYVYVCHYYMSIYRSFLVLHMTQVECQQDDWKNRRKSLSSTYWVDALNFPIMTTACCNIETTLPSSKHTSGSHAQVVKIGMQLKNLICSLNVQIELQHESEHHSKAKFKRPHLVYVHRAIRGS